VSLQPTNQLPPVVGPKDKFTPELRILVASLLSMVVILLWAKYFGPKPPVNPNNPNQPRPSAPAVPGNPANANVPGSATTPSTVSAAQNPAVPATADAQERTIVVENELYRVEFSNRGAVVKSWRLKKYKDDSKPPEVLDVVHPQASTDAGGWPLALVFDDPQLGNLANSGLYKISSDSRSLEAPAELSFTWSNGHLQVIKKFHFDHSYTVDVQTSVTNDGHPALAGLGWLGGFGDLTVTNPIPVETEYVFYSDNGKLTTLPHKKLKNADEFGNIWQGGTSWAGIEDRYFTAVFLPSLSQPSPLEVRYWKAWHVVKVDGKDQSEPIPQVAATMALAPMKMRVFVGPKDYDLLKKLNPPLHALVNFGWLEIIADPLFHGLKWLHNYIPNWGWAIVVLTLIINMVLFPLRISSYKTTMKMQRVAPEIKQIQERYKKYKMNDPRKAEMNKEVMAVYSREGINPVGGCIPQLLQMPIWFGLYRALQGTIELRHAPWFGWITDLSAKDPYYILPLLMGLSMYFSSKMTPMTATDPQQAQMMKIMPLAMSGIFFIIPYPSGLAVYILTSGLVGVVQQWYLNRTHPLPAPAKPTRAKK